MGVPYLIGAGGAVVFVVVVLIEGWARPGFSPVLHPVSALALGERGWIQTLNFVICGAAITVGAGALTVAGPHRWLGGLLAMFGLALVASGLFRMDPMRGYPPGTPEADPEVVSTQHTWHDHAGALVFAALPIAAVVAAVVLPGAPWTIGSAAMAVLLTGATVEFGRAWERDSPETGLIQRAYIIPGWLWVAAVFIHLAADVAR